MNVLVINAGSSSLKYQLFNMKTKEVVAKGICDRIGIDGHIKHTPVSNGKPEYSSDIPLPTHAEAISAVIEKLISAEYGVIGSLSEINAVGHRIVHGGPWFSESVLIDTEVMSALEKCVRLAPLHNPANILGINACKNSMPNTPQAAVFDTAFHSTIPEYAYVYPIPYRYYEDNHIRKYGFHGTSHRYVSSIAINKLGGGANGTRIITCHLGNGSSLAAIKDGICVDTTMGVTPLEGVPMGTRCGSVDPTLIEILSNIEGGLSITETMNILNKESGVLGVSGVSSDFRDIYDAVKSGLKEDAGAEAVATGKRARLALDIFAYQVAKFIGSYIAVMGGLDALVFTAGIGENSPLTRKSICNQLNEIGIKIDEDKNSVRGANDFLDITGNGSTSKIFVISTNEELVIASDTVELVS